MSEMKMSDEMKSIQGVKVSDVFDLTKVSFPSSYTDNQVRVAGRAIANYDRMVEEIAELKDKVDELRKDKFQLIDAAEYLHEKLIKEGKRYGASINRKMISKLLAKLNQEGEG